MMPPENTPTDCKVLYTPIAVPLRSLGAILDTSEGILASKILKPIKYTTKLSPMSHAAFRLPNSANCAAVVKPMPSKTRV